MRISQVDKGVGDAKTRQKLLEHLDRLGVERDVDHHMVSWVEQREQRGGDGRNAGCRHERGFAALQTGHDLGQCIAIGIPAAPVAIHALFGRQIRLFQIVSVKGCGEKDGKRLRLHVKSLDRTTPVKQLCLTGNARAIFVRHAKPLLFTPALLCTARCKVRMFFPVYRIWACTASTLHAAGSFPFLCANSAAAPSKTVLTFALICGKFIKHLACQCAGVVQW